MNHWYMNPVKLSLKRTQTLWYDLSRLGIKLTGNMVDVYDTVMVLLHVTVWKSAINTLSKFPTLSLRVLLSAFVFCRELLVIGKFGSGAVT